MWQNLVRLVSTNKANMEINLSGLFGSLMAENCWKIENGSYDVDFFNWLRLTLFNLGKKCSNICPLILVIYFLNHSLSDLSTAWCRAALAVTPQARWQWKRASDRFSKWHYWKLLKHRLQKRLGNWTIHISHCLLNMNSF